MKIERIILYTILALAIPIIFNIIKPGHVGVPLFISGLILLYLAYCLYMSKQYEVLNGKTLLKVWMSILFFGSLRALVLNYTSFNGLRDSLLSFLNISIILCVFIGNIWNLKTYLKYFLIIMIPCAAFSALSWRGYGLTDVAHILYPISLFLLILPYVTKKTKILILTVAIISLFYDISVRSNVFLLGGTLVFLCIYYISKNSVVLKYRRLIWSIFLILPLVLLLLGVLGKYNIFKEIMSSDIHIEVSGSKNRSNYLTDSRTMVYVDVLNSIDGIDGWLLGYSPVSKIKTGMSKNNSDYKMGRNSTECGFLNILYYYGFIGIICFLVIIIYSSYLGLFKSNNKLVMMIGLYVAFKFFFMFLEEPSISMTTYFAIGLCLNSSFREMSDQQIIDALI